MWVRLRVPLFLALALFAALLAAARFSNAAVSFRSAEREGDRVAEVLIGQRVVIVLRTKAAGYGPLERAEIVSSRLRAAIADEVVAGDVEVGPIASGSGLFINDQLIVAVYPDEAGAHGKTSEALAGLWRDDLLLALGMQPAPLAGEEAAGAEEAGEQGQEPDEDLAGGGEPPSAQGGERPPPSGDLVD